MLKQYLTQPYPAKNEIVHQGKRLIQAFSTEKQEVFVDEEIRLDLSFALRAMRGAEVVRLKASAGTLTRKEGEVFFRCAKPGKQQLALEFITRTSWQGKVDSADRRTLEIVVKPRPNAQ